MSPQTALNSHPPSGRMHRSTTAPNLSSNNEGLRFDHPISAEARASVAMDDQGGDDNSDICLSPSWTEFGNKKKKDRKKVERERKENEKKQKKELKELLEQQKAAEAKAGKRLSKKPPAAMDTQKMPSALRRNSGHSFMSWSLSHEDSRRSSREEKRSSGISIISKDQRHSQSTPGTSTDILQDSQGSSGTIASSAAPQIPKMRNFSWHSQHSSSGNSSGGDVVNERALLDFPHRLEATATPLDPQKSPTVPPKDYRPVTQLAQNHQQINKPLPRSQTTPDIQPKQSQALNGKSVERFSPAKHEGSVDDFVFQEPGGPRSGHRQAKMTQKMLGEPPKVEPERKVMSDEFFRTSRMNAGNDAQKAQPLQIKSHRDGSSYVHKQRMYQQQRSIAGYQDELAIRDANEPKSEYVTMEKSDPSTVPSRSVSSESTKPPTRQTSIDCDCNPEDETAQQELHEQSHVHRKEPRDVAVNQPHISSGSMADKLLGFRRFQRKGKPTSPLTTLKPTSPTASSIANSGPTPQPPTNTQTHASMKRSSTVGGMLGEPTPSPTDTGAIAIRKKNPLENEIEKPWVQNHSRTRTSSSQLLNDNLLLKPLPRSSTAPVLPMTNQISQSPKVIDQSTNPQASGRLEPASPKRITPRGPRSPPADIKPLPKIAPEIVIESVTGEGLVHKTSIKRPRSNPMLQTTITSPHQLPSLDFLPQLRHQPLTKPKRTSPIRPNSSISPTFPASSSTFPAPSSPVAKSSSEPHLPSTNTPDLKQIPRSPLRPPYHQPRPENALIRPGQNIRRRTMDPTGTISTLGPLSFGKGGSAEGLEPKPIAKLFVICCKCKFWHDLPSKMYELMALPQKLSRKPEGGEINGNTALEKSKEARLDTMVKCPWCDHYMTTWCCAGWTTVVYLHERHH